MSCEHVAEQTDGERDEAQEGREKLDDPHEHVHREAHALRGEALDVADHAVSLASVVDEIHEGEDGERGGGADCTGAGLHSRDQADHVIDQDEQESEHRNGKCFFQFSPTTPLPNIVLDVLDDVLETVDEEALGNQGLLLLNTARTIRSTIVETISQNEYCVMPQLRSPTTGVELNSLTR